MVTSRPGEEMLTFTLLVRIVVINLHVSFQLDDCVWVQCIDPPTPPGMNVKHDWDELTPYEFLSNATYTCDSDGLYFEEDRSKESFTVQCLPNGKWDTPNPWPQCVQSK